MRRWLLAAVAAFALVSDRPQLWVSGGLAWAATVGPVALLAAVFSTPAVSELSYVGARLYGSGAWPWNVVALGLTLVILVVLALGLVALAEAVLLRGDRAPSAPAAAGLRCFAVTLVGALPALATAAATLVALAGVAPDEFTSPDTAVGGPLVRTAVRLGPLLALLVLVSLLGGAYATAARVLVVCGGANVRSALVGAPRLLAASASSTLAQTLASFLVWLIYLAFAILLLRVLWDPIGLQVADGAGFGPAQYALLVGFVAIWLCLVLGGGALRAWTSTSWARTLAEVPGSVQRTVAESREMPSNP